MEPDEARLRHDLEGANFQVGVDKKMWQLLNVDWPYAFIKILAALRAGAPDGYVLKLRCDGYPQMALTAQFWDVPANTPLDPSQWPTGTDRVQGAFNPGWKRDALYLPFDRIAMSDHDAWKTAHPELLWGPKRDITFYLRWVYGLLNTSEYTGIRGS